MHSETLLSNTQIDPVESVQTMHGVNLADCETIESAKCECAQS